MKQIKFISFLVLAVLGITSMNAQTDSLASNTNTTVYTSSKAEATQIVERENYAGDWVLGFGVNIVGDDGKGDPFDIFEKHSRHFYNPYTIRAEYYTSDQFSFNASLSFNRYIAGKIVDGGIIQEGKEATYMAFDISPKYSFRELLKSSWFEPYVVLGMGYTNIGSHTTLNGGQLTDIPTVGRMTVNTGFGANFWFSKELGLNLNFLGKKGIKAGKNKIYINERVQFSMSALYRIKNM